MTDYKYQDKKLALDVLERNYFSFYRKGKKHLEIFLFGQCSAGCEYCYLYKNNSILYPKNISNVDKILKNLDILLKWYIKNHFYCPIHIFSAEWLNIDNLRDKVFKIFYNNFKNSHKKPLLIDIPTNASFIENEVQTKIIQKWINKFKNELDIQILLSISIDGKYCDDGRVIHTDEYYEKLFNFTYKNNFLFHPMVSSYNVKNWIENYKWWVSNNQNDLMMLEVRDETWTKESINDLLKFLDFEINYKFKNNFNSNKKLFLKYILGLRDNKYQWPQYNNISLLQIISNYDFATCTVNDSCLPIRVGDLSVAMCHRLYYEELEIGKFIIKNDEIVDFDETNVALLIAKGALNRQYLPHCETCKFRKSCVGFCLGNSYENYMNPFVPTMEVCEMYTVKITFLFMKYLQMGLFDELENIKDELNDETIKYLTDSIREISGGIKEND